MTSALRWSSLSDKLMVMSYPSDLKNTRSAVINMGVIQAFSKRTQFSKHMHVITCKGTDILLLLYTYHLLTTGYTNVDVFAGNLI